MVQIISDPTRGNIWGRISRGVAQGVAEQAPQEIERYRTAKGLEKFEQEAGNLTPMQQLARLSSIPGITPQQIQSFGELAKQQAQAGALSKGINKQEQPTEFPRTPRPQKQETPKTPSITTTEPIKATIENYIPKSYEQILDRAGQLYNENQALYKNDPQLALQAATQEDAQNQSINAAQQTKRKTQQDVQTRVQNELRTQAENAGVTIPDNVYSDIENRALDAVNSGEMTELQAGKHFKKELDAISRDYKAIETVGTAKLISRSPSGNKDALRSIRNKFKERNDLENFTDAIIANNGLSPSKAAYLAYDIKDNKEMNNAIANLKPLTAEPKFEKGYFTNEIPSEKIENETLKISKKLAPLLKKDVSPLAVAEELKSRGYDPQVWMRYLDQNRKNLEFSEWQGRQLDKPRNFSNTLNDIWMFTWSGLDKLVEQK